MICIKINTDMIFRTLFYHFSTNLFFLNKLSLLYQFLSENIIIILTALKTLQFYSYAKSVVTLNIFEINIAFNDSNWGLKFTFYYYLVWQIYQLLYNFNIYRSYQGSRFSKREEPAKSFSLHTWKEIELHLKTFHKKHF